MPTKTRDIASKAMTGLFAHSTEQVNFIPARRTVLSIDDRRCCRSGAACTGLAASASSAPDSRASSPASTALRCVTSTPPVASLASQGADGQGLGCSCTTAAAAACSSADSTTSASAVDCCWSSLPSSSASSTGGSQAEGEAPAPRSLAACRACPAMPASSSPAAQAQGSVGASKGQPTRSTRWQSAHQLPLRSTRVPTSMQDRPAHLLLCTA